MMRLLMSAAVVASLALSGQAMATKLKDQTGVDAPLGSRSILSPAKVDERTAPEARVCLQGESCGEAVAAAGDAGGGAASAPKTPEEIYNANCMACHATGAAGAPKTGDTAAWQARLAQGIETVYDHAINGLNAMPPRGMCMSCSDDDIKAVVDYMVEKSQ